MQRTRKVFGISIKDFWYEPDAFNKSFAGVKIVHSPVKPIANTGIIVNELTYIINLFPAEEKIFSAFSAKSARYPIRKCIAAGYQVRGVNSAFEVESFLKFFNNFAFQKKIPTINLEELEQYKIFCAYTITNELQGGIALITSEPYKTVRYKHGASLHGTNVNDLLIWEAIRWAKGEGYMYFDMGGIATAPKVDSDAYKINKFKAKFGGELTKFYTVFYFNNWMKPLEFGLKHFVTLFFKGDYNKFTNFLNKLKSL